jgi:hypothetical protein
VVEKGDPIPWVVQVEGKESWQIGIVVGEETGNWVVECVDSGQESWTPCGLIASSQGGLLLRENEQQAYG